MMPRWKKICLGALAAGLAAFLSWSLILGDVPVKTDAEGGSRLQAAEETLPCHRLEQTFVSRGGIH